MDKITQVGQKGYSKTKQCQEVLLSLISGADYARKHGKRGLIISLDMKKAFDSLSHDYLKSCLRFLGFGEYITKWLLLVSTNRKACVELAKNKTSACFRLERGNAQGDVISPFLFNIGYQILLLKLEKDEGITGFYEFLEDTVNLNIPGTISRACRKAFAFADDGNLLVEASLSNLNRIKKILNDFSNISGLECNLEKSAMMQIGILDELDEEIINAGFPLVDKLKILGTVLNSNCVEFNETITEITDKIQGQINIWSRFNLSLTGRINIAKTMLYSQINYNGCFLPVPDVDLSAIEEKITRFVVGKTKIARDRIFSPIKFSGLGLFPVREFLGAQKCSWILRARSNDEVWKIDFNKRFSGKLEHISCNKFNKNETPMFNNWAEQWENFYEKFTALNYLNVPVLDNKTLTLHLRTKNFMTVGVVGADFPNHMVDELYNLKLRCLVNNTGDVKSFEHFSRAVNLPLNVQSYNVLLRILSTAKTRFENSGSDSIDSFFRTWKKGSVKIRKVMCTKKSQNAIPHNIVKFSDTTDTVIDLENSKKLNSQWSQNFYSPAQRAFLFKFVNNILGINTRVSHFNRDIDRNCEFCNIMANPDPEDETILHLFYDCDAVENIRTRFFNELIGRDVSRHEFFNNANLDLHSKNFTLKIITNLFAYFVWESKKRYCLPSYTLLKQYIAQELKTMSACSNRVKKLIIDSGLHLL
jgi:hypothetical protein